VGQLVDSGNDFVHAHIDYPTNIGE
jgi:hypothetical protein